MLVLSQSRTHCKYLTVDFLELVSRMQNTILTDLFFFLNCSAITFSQWAYFFLIWQIVFILHDYHLLTIKY